MSEINERVPSGDGGRRMTKTDVARRLTVGAELQTGGGAHVRVWAPACGQVDLIVPSATGGTPEEPSRVLSMTREADGHFSVFDDGARAGGRYWFRLNGGRTCPDPASRHQPDGPHEPSAYVDPYAFEWTDGSRPGLRPLGQVIYEMHVGTFTPEGTWRAAAAQLD